MTRTVPDSSGTGAHALDTARAGRENVGVLRRRDGRAQVGGGVEMRELLENSTARLSYRIATAWRYRCAFCGRHHGDRDSASRHAVVCGKNPQGLPRGVAFVRDTDSGILHTSDAAREAAALNKPRRVLVARYVCKYCRGSFASISGIAAHEAKCDARPTLRGCRSCAHLEHELDGGCDCGDSRCDVPDVHKVPVCAAQDEWLDDLVTDCRLWKLRVPSANKALSS